MLKPRRIRHLKVLQGFVGVHGGQLELGEVVEGFARTVLPATKGRLWGYGVLDGRVIPKIRCPLLSARLLSGRVRVRPSVLFRA